MHQEQPILFPSEKRSLPSCLRADNIPSESTSRSVTKLTNHSRGASSMLHQKANLISDINSGNNDTWGSQNGFCFQSPEAPSKTTDLSMAMARIHTLHTFIRQLFGYHHDPTVHLCSITVVLYKSWIGRGHPKQVHHILQNLITVFRRHCIQNYAIFLK